MADLIVDFLKRCRELDKEYAYTSTAGIWFRGQGNACPPRPSALRKKFLDKAHVWVSAHANELERRTRWMTDMAIDRMLDDHNLAGYFVEQIANSRFRREASPFFEDPEDLRMVYMQARHSDLPSRLLDWTTNPLTALFFAATHKPGEDGVVFVFNPTDYYYYTILRPSSSRPEVTDGTPTPVTDSHAAFREQLPSLFDPDALQTHRPADGPDSVYADYHSANRLPVPETNLKKVLPILPTHLFPRLTAQHSCFTFHPPSADRGVPEEQILERITVPADAKEETLRGLRLLGISESTAWPDVDGTARAIRSSLGLP